MTTKKKRTAARAVGRYLGIALLLLAGLSRTGISGEELARQTALDNGLTIILDTDESSPTTILQILVRGGKRAEPSGKRGLAFLTTRLSVEIPDSGKAQELISLATRFSVTTLEDHSLINIECLSDNLADSLDVIAKIILDPLFSGIRIDAVKQNMEHQGRIEEDDSVRLGHLAALGAFFGGTPYEGSIYGNKESLKTIKGRDVSDFYKRIFVGTNMILSLSSDLPDKALLDLVSKHFSGLPEGEPISFDPVPISDPEQRSIRLERETKQTYVSLGFRLPAISPQNFALASFLESLLGKGPGSKLWPLRTEQRLAYNVNCRATLMQSGGILEAYLETDKAKLETARAALRETFIKLSEGGVAEEELEATKTAVIADFVRNNEMKSGRVATLAFFESVGLGPGYFSGFSSEVEALTLDEVNAALKSLLAPDKSIEVVIGP